MNTQTLDMFPSPGPWTIYEENGEIEIRDANGKAITTIPYEFRTARDEANARLIAAAPDLLEALQKILWTPIDVTDLEKYASVLVLARAALAKAEGGQP